MNSTMQYQQSRTKRTVAAALAGILASAVAISPVAGAANANEAEREISLRPVDRAQLENLQRWVSAGHEDWCKDARLVAAEQLQRMAPDFVDASQLHALLADTSGAKKFTFEWAPLDGRAVYRVTVERFDWLMPIAKDQDAVVWAPTATEVIKRNASGEATQSSTAKRSLTSRS